MASIQEIINQDGKKVYKVQIRKKNANFYKTFLDLETAELYAWYKEKLIDEMESFDVPKSELITLKDACEIKIKYSQEETRHKKYLSDLKKDIDILLEYLGEETSLTDITFEVLDEMVNKMKNTTVFRGGSQYDIKNGKISGKEVQISPHTIRRRLASLSTIYNEVISRTGLEITNPVTSYKPYFTKNYLKKE